MLETGLPALTAWESFYVIVGSSAAALTGLQFVVIVLAAEARALGGAPAVRAFGTPTVVHFCVVLLVSAIISAPWHRLGSAASTLAVTGAGGLGFALLVVREARRQKGYAPVLEDWIWHAVFPLVAYSGLLVAALLLPGRPGPSLFAIGGAVVMLLFVGIHNAWDAVTYIALRERHGENVRKQ